MFVKVVRHLSPIRPFIVHRCRLWTTFRVFAGITEGVEFVFLAGAVGGVGHS